MEEQTARPSMQQEADELASQMQRLLRHVRKTVDVSIAKDNMTIRKNGPCPCGSQKKFKRCCLPEVKAGNLDYINKKGFRRESNNS